MIFNRPTHDDVTFEGVAKAFEDTTFLHPEMEVLIRQFFKDVNEATLKLGQVRTPFYKRFRKEMCGFFPS